MKVPSFLVLFITFGVYSQTFYVISPNTSGGGGNTCELFNLSDCSHTNVPMCTTIGASGDLAVNATGDLFFGVGENKLYKQDHDQSTCTEVGSFPLISPFNYPVINAITAGANNTIYAVGNKGNSPVGMILYKYTPDSGIVVLGMLPPQLLSVGDLFFYENRLFLICRNLSLSEVYLLEVNINNPVESNIYMTFDQSVVPPYGAFSVNEDGVSKSYLLSRGFTGGRLYELDIQTQTVTLLDCTELDGMLNGGDAYYEFSDPSLAAHQDDLVTDHFDIVNPAKDFIDFDTNSSLHDFQSFLLFDTLGKKVRDYINDKILSLSGLTPGLYFLQIITNKNKCINKKILVRD